MQCKKTIGVFDSGIGGLSVLSYARTMMPDVDFLYDADTVHVPYGTKTREEIVRYSLDAADFLIRSGAQAILVACNTATSMAVDLLRASFREPIVGMEPAVKPALTLHPHERILVCATPATIRGQKLHDLLERNADSDDKVDLCELPGLVTYAERGFFDPVDTAAYIREQVSRTDYTACVLGCTHFAFFRPAMRLAFPHAELIDGTEGTVRRLCAVTGYEKGHRGEPGRVRYFQSGVAVTDPLTLDYYEMLERRSLVQE